MPTVQDGLAAADNCRVAASGRCAACELTFQPSRLVRSHDPRHPGKFGKAGTLGETPAAETWKRVLVDRTAPGRSSYW